MAVNTEICIREVEKSVFTGYDHKKRKFMKKIVDKLLVNMEYF